MPNLIDYMIENREKVITAFMYFTVIGGPIYIIGMLLALHYR